MIVTPKMITKTRAINGTSEQHYDFFHGWEGFSTRNDFYDEDAKQFSSWRSRCAQQTRREESKIKHDSRDRKAKSWSKDKRMFCGVNQGITKGNAVMSGL
jgi:hypothetical protein